MHGHFRASILLTPRGFVTMSCKEPRTVDWQYSFYPKTLKWSKWFNSHAKETSDWNANSHRIVSCSLRSKHMSNIQNNLATKCKLKLLNLSKSPITMIAVALSGPFKLKQPKIYIYIYKVHKIYSQNHKVTYGCAAWRLDLDKKNTQWQSGSVNENRFRFGKICWSTWNTSLKM